MALGGSSHTHGPLDAISSAEPAFAAKGSQRWLQIAVNRRPEVLNAPLRRALGVPDGTPVEWLSPLASERFVEYRDGATYDRLGVALRRPWQDFWPSGGPMWDGLARAGEARILVEAKAHIPEVVSTGTRATGAARERVAASLRAVQDALAPRNEGTVDWTGTFYQYANRLAHLHFLREDNGVPAHLVYVYFLNATDVRGPADRLEWEGALKVVECYLGLGRHRLARYVHKLYVDCNQLAGAAA